jgi:hypothetical protein
METTKSIVGNFPTDSIQSQTYEVLDSDGTTPQAV